MEKYVIIGNGVAAAACVEGIRSVDSEGSITVISGENYPVYCRPLISYYLEGRTDPARMLYRREDFYERMKCKVIYGRCAEGIDKEAREIRTDDGSLLPYTKLCIAAGSSPFCPPFEGLDGVTEKHSFMTLYDAEELKKAAGADSRVLIIGAGLIGLKCAEGLRETVREITVCDLSERILSSILDSEVADSVQHYLEEKGIEFMLSDSVTTFEGNTAVMKSGSRVDFDILVLAIGVRANTSLASEIGAKVNRGIIIDEKMSTSIPGIYACGDCSEGYDASLGTARVLALMPNAYNQGFCAGVNMAGGEQIYNTGIPMNSLGLFGLHIMTAGTRYDEPAGGTEYTERTERGVKKLYMRGGVLTGFMLLGETDRAGIYTAMIRNRTPLDSVDFEMMKKIPTTAAFFQDKRRIIFGGVV